MSERRWTVIFDDTCGFCQFHIRWLRRLDWLGKLRFISLADSEVAILAPTLTQEDLHRAMQIVSPDGKLSSGPDAVREATLRIPLLCWFGALLWLPGLRQLSYPAYRWVARNRYRISRFYPAVQACEIRRPGKTART